MLRTFTPTPRNELDKPPIKPGVYWFSVDKVLEKDGKKGKYYEVQLKVITEQGRAVTVFDGLSLVENMHWKLCHFFDSIGMSEMYDSGRIIFEKILGAKGVAELHEQEYNGKINIKVKDYIKREDQGAHDNNSEHTNDNEEATFNDDIPF